MKYRKFGKLDWEVSALGFGAMRLPVIGDNPAAGNPDINEPEAVRMIRHSIDPRMARFRYRQETKEAWADNCIECLECEEKCPQEIPIAEWLLKAHEYLGPRKKT